jgi:hypothetical protein
MTWLFCLKCNIVTRNLSLYRRLNNWFEAEDHGICVTLTSPEDFLMEDSEGLGDRVNLSDLGITERLSKQQYILEEPLCVLFVDLETLDRDVNECIRKVSHMSDTPIILILPSNQAVGIEVVETHKYLRQIKQPLEIHSVIDVICELLESYLRIRLNIPLHRQPAVDLIDKASIC